MTEKGTHRDPDGGYRNPWHTARLPGRAELLRWWWERAYRELDGGTFAAMHWGTFRLTDEDPLEPPERTRAAWRQAGLPEQRLWIPAFGETRRIAPHE